jgi:hypothetical protein
MIISDDHRLAFVHIPKCAGVSVKQPLRQIDSTAGFYSRIADHPELGRIHYAHIVLRDLARYFPEDFRKVADYRTFAVVRDPVPRFLSALSQRMREFKQIAQSQITAERIELEAEAVIRLLEREPDRLGLELVHFNRQIDYVDLDGRRYIDDLFAIEKIGALTRYVAERTGIDVTEERKNRSTELRFARLRPIVRALRRPYAAAIPYRWRAAMRARLVAAGVYRDVDKQALLPRGGRIEGFVRAYYAADFELHAANR